MIKAVLFDMDGVLIDSIPSAYNARKKLLAEHGIDADTLPDPLNEGHRGSSVKTLLEAVENHHGTKIDKEWFASNAIDYIYKDLQDRNVSADPDLIQFLIDLRKHGLKCAITTSGLRQSVQNKLNILDISPYFDLIITGDDAKKHKPDPEPYTLTMQKLDVNPSECIVIEDSLTGTQSGLAAGCKVVGFIKHNADHEPFPKDVAVVDNWAALSWGYLSKTFD